MCGLKDKVYVIRLAKRYQKELRKLLLVINPAGSLAKAMMDIKKLLLGSGLKVRVLEGEAPAGHMEHIVQSYLEKHHGAGTPKS